MAEGVADCPRLEQLRLTLLSEDSLLTFR
jgi:hypothetical protein